MKAMETWHRKKKMEDAMKEKRSRALKNNWENWIKERLNANEDRIKGRDNKQKPRKSVIKKKEPHNNRNNKKRNKEQYKGDKRRNNWIYW